MKRILCIWLPDWPIQRRVADRPELDGLPLLLHARHPRRGQCVAACSAAARRAGVRRGMPLTEAAALLGAAVLSSATRASRTTGSPHSTRAPHSTRVPHATSLPGATGGLSTRAPLSPGGRGAGGEGETLRNTTPTGNTGLETVLPHDPQADREALLRLAERCERFSPLVGLEDAAEPECLLLDVTSLGPLFGGEGGLAEAIDNDFRRQGYRVRIGIAGTLGAAWALGRFRISDCRFQIYEPKARTLDDAFTSSPLQSEICNLKSLPVSALRLSDETLRLLDRLGIERIEQLLQLPRAGLSSRFPADTSGRCLLLERLDQFTGAAEELIVPHRAPPEFSAEWLLEHPTDRRDAIQTILAQLVDRVAGMLLAHGRGAIRVACRLDCAGGPPLSMQVGLYRPAADPRHLLELLQMQLERMALPGSVGRVGVEVTIAAPLAEQQGELFADAVRDAPRHLAVLVDRLSSRLGRQAVLRPRLSADALPERACRYLPLTGRQPSGRRRAAAAKSNAKRNGNTQPNTNANRRGFAPGERPLQLISPPAEIETLSVAPDGPPVRFTWRRRGHQVARYWGPERIETGWWRGRTVRRDYYRVETARGERYWLFRLLGDGRWFLHGVFA